MRFASPDVGSTSGSIAERFEARFWAPSSLIGTPLEATESSAQVFQITLVLYPSGIDAATA